MKKVLLLTALLLGSHFAFGQAVLTEATHGLIPGNENPMITTTFSDPGVAGEDVLWDFSALPQVAPFLGDVVAVEGMNAPAGIKDANTTLVEGDLEVFMNTSNKQLAVKGLRYGDAMCVRTYESPVIKMKYPFAYGDQYAGEAIGQQQYEGGYSHPVRMRFDVKADAHGTLLLPGTTLRKVLRVVTKHELAYRLEEDAPTATVVTYRWYVKEHRFPVLSLIFEERNGELIPIKGAYNPVVQLPEDVKVLAEEQSKPSVEKASKGNVSAVSVSPNPFREQLNVAYQLKGSANVTIALYSLKGELVKSLMQQYQPEGAYQQNFQIKELATGMYIIRVEAGGKVLSQQVVKMQ
ncbi:MAG: hypothetical protein CSA07_04690 [Bacteroidia bacterium]|nr:MAG: hypothetical protein CSA07_04690 [Bacteroidia bacterium]